MDRKSQAQAAYEWKFEKIRDRKDRLTLRYATFKQAAKETKKAIIFSPGRSEYIEKYQSLINDLWIPEDCAFIVADHRGQGASGAARGHVESYEDYASDLSLVIENSIGTQTPYVIIGHSMGALIALYGTMSHAIRPIGLALSSPLLALPERPVPGGLQSKICSLLCKGGFATTHTGFGLHDKASFASNRLTNDYQRFKIIKNSPYPSPSPTFGWVTQTYKATMFVRNTKNISEYNVPTLLMTAGNETVVNPAGFKDWRIKVSRYSSAKLTYHNIPGAKHELFFEAPQFYNKTIQWTNQWLKELLLPTGHSLP